MARKKEKPTLTKELLDLAEAGQAFLGKVAGGSTIVKAFVGSDSDAYVQAQWRKQKHINHLDLNTVRTPGDPNIGKWAGKMARNWRKAAIFAINAEFYEEIKDRHKNAVPAVAYVAQRIVRVGTLPEGSEFGHLAHNNMKSVAMRLGHDELVSSMGLWLPDEKELIVPDKIFTLDTTMPTNILTEFYKDTPLV